MGDEEPKPVPQVLEPATLPLPAKEVVVEALRSTVNGLNHPLYKRLQSLGGSPEAQPLENRINPIQDNVYRSPPDEYGTSPGSPGRGLPSK